MSSEQRTPLLHSSSSGAQAADGSIGPKPAVKPITLWPLVVLIFFEVSGGPFGTEDAVSAAGPLLTVLGFIILPLVWSVPEALVTAELSTAFPENSGYVAWVTAAFGPYWGFLEGLWSWLSGVTDNSLYPVMLAANLQLFFPVLGEEGPTRSIFVVGLCLALSYFNYRGLTVVGHSLVASALAVLLPFVLMSALAIPKVRPANWTVVDWDTVNWGTFINVMFWNLNYWDSVSTLAGEVSNPSKTFPRAMLLAVLLVVVMYLVPALTALGVAEPGASGDDWGLGYYAKVAKDLGGSWLAVWVLFAAAFSQVGQYQAEMASDSYQLQGMAERGFLPLVLARHHRPAAAAAAAGMERPGDDEASGYVIKALMGNANPKLGKDISEALGVRLCDCEVAKFADGEINMQIKENIRGADVFVIQGTSPPVNDNLMELLLLLQTIKLSSAKRITAVIPYYGYARQDRKTRPRVPISASAVAQLIETMGADRVVTVDLHCGQIQGFFHHTPVDNLFAEGEFIDTLRLKYPEPADVVIVSPDAGGVLRARRVADKLHAENVATILKRRAQANVIEAMQIVGSVDGKKCVIIDDIIDTAGTLCKAAELLKENGATDVIACATHGVFSGGAAMDRINASCLTAVYVTDSIPQEHNKARCDKLHVLSIAPLLARAIRRIHEEKSLSVLFANTL